MRACDGCTKCCTGLLSGNARGAYFGILKPCKYLVGGCSIYEDRPTSCKTYYCAWAQELLPEWMKPSELGVIVSAEIDVDGKQFLKVVSDQNITAEVEAAINSFTKENNTYYTKVLVISIGRE